MTEMAKNSGVGWKTLYRIWPTLEWYGVVKMQEAFQPAVQQFVTQKPGTKE